MESNFNGLNKTKMENIEELLRDAFKAGMNKGSHQSYFDAPLDETEYIDSIKDKLKLFFIPVVVKSSPVLERCGCPDPEIDSILICRNCDGYVE
tara:strand:- start:185 stop:466 length:282 start_codon:yes stop_codon:yes gene_type:complete